MSIIEDRVVRASFDNSGFDSKVEDSTRSIEKFEKAINGKDFSGSFNPLLTAIGAASQEFSKLEMVAVGVMTNIATSVVNAGRDLVKSFTLDPVTQGFNKYEMYTDSIQTVMAATGKSMEEIEGYMEKLRWFSDETSYSLTDMTSNIGKFTAAGVDLDKSVTAMIGISNLAAISGQRSAEAARVMYNASQALGQGYMAAIDWKSIENANMATMEFKQILIDTAVEMGTVQKAGEDLENTYIAVGVEAKNLEKHQFNATSMRNTLSDKWLTGDVFVKALENYGKFSEQVYDLYTEMNDNLGEDKLTTEILDDIKLFADATDDELKALGYSSETAISIFRELSDQVGSLGNRAFLTAQETKTFTDMVSALQDATSTAWSKVYEAIFGNYVEAKEFWSELVEQLYDLAVVPVQGIVQRLKEWKKIGGRDDFLQGIKNSLQFIQNLVDHLTQSFREIFPKKTAQEWKKATERFKDFTAKLVELTEVVKKIREPIDEITEKIENASEVAEEAIEPIAEGIEKVGDAIEETIENFDTEYVARGIDKIMTGFKGILSVVGIAFDAISGIFKMVKDDAGFIAGNLIETILNAIEKAGQWLIDLRSELNSNGFVVLFDTLSRLFTAIKDVVWDIYSFGKMAIYEIFGDPDEAEEVADRFGVINKVIWFIADAIDHITSKLSDADLFGKLDSVFSAIDWTKVKSTFESMKTSIGGIFSAIGSKVKSEAPKILNSISEGFSKLWDRLAKVNWQSVIEDKINGITRVVNKLKDAFTRANITGMFDSIFKFGLHLFDAGKTFFATLDVSDLIVTSVDIITAAFKQARKILENVNIGRLVSNTVNIVSGAIKQVSKVISSANFSNLINTGIKLLTNLTGQIKSFINRANISGFVSNLMTLISKLGSQISAIVNKTDFAGIASTLLNIVIKGIKQINKVLTEVDFSGLVSKFFNLFGKALGKIDSALDKIDLTFIVKKAVELTEVLMDLADKALNKIDLVAIANGFAEVCDNVKDFIEAYQKGFDVEGYEKIKRFYDFMQELFSWIGGFFKSLDENDTIQNVFFTAIETAKEFGRVAKEAFSLVRPFFDGLFGNENTAKNAEKTSEAFGWVGEATRFVVDALDLLREKLSDVNLAGLTDNAYELGQKVREEALKIIGYIQWAFNKAKQILSELTDIVSDFVSNVKNEGIVSAIGKVFLAIFGKGEEEGNYEGTVINEWPKRVSMWEKMLTIVRGAIESVANVLMSISDMFNAFAYSMFNGIHLDENGNIKAYEATKQSMMAIGAVIGELLHVILVIAETIAQMMIEHPIDFAKLVFSLYLAAAIVSVIWNFSRVLKRTSYLMDEVTELTATIGGKTRSAAKIIKNLAIALGIVAVSITLFANMPHDNLMQGLAVIGWITVIFALFTGYLANLSKSSANIIKYTKGEKIFQARDRLVSASVALIAIALTVSIVTNQLIKISREMYSDDQSKMDELRANIIFSAAVVVGLIYALSKAFQSITKTDIDKADWKKSTHNVAMIITMTKAIGAMVKVMGDLHDSEVSWDEALVYGGVMAVMMPVLAASVLIMSRAFREMNDETAKTSSKVNTKSIFGMAALVLAISGAMWIISKAITELASGINTENSGSWDILLTTMLGLAAITAGILVAVYLLVSEFNKSEKTVNAGTLLSLSVMFVAIAGAMWIVSDAINSLRDTVATLGAGNFAVIGGIFAGLIAVMGLISILLTKVGGTDWVSAAVKMLAFAASFFVIGIALGQVAEAFGKIAAIIFATNLSAEVISEITTMFIALTAIMGVVSVLLGVIGGAFGAGSIAGAALMVAFGASLLLAAQGMKVFAEAIGIFISQITVLASMPWGEILSALGKLSVVSIGLSLLSLPMMAAGLGLGAFAVGVLLLGAACLVAVSAVDKFYELINKMAESIDAIPIAVESGKQAIRGFVDIVVSAGFDILHAIQALSTEFITTVKVITLAIIASIREQIPEFTLLVYDIMVMICKVITMGAPAAAEAFLTVVDYILQSLADHLPSIVASLKSIIKTLWEDTGIGNFLKSKLEKGKNIIFAFGKLIKAAVHSFLVDIVQGAKWLITELIVWILKKFDDFLEGFQDIATPFAEALKKIGVDIDISGIGSALDATIAKFESKADDAQTAMRDAAQEVEDAKQEFFNAFKDPEKEEVKKNAPITYADEYTKAYNDAASKHMLPTQTETPHGDKGYTDEELAKQTKDAAGESGKESGGNWIMNFINGVKDKFSGGGGDIGQKILSFLGLDSISTDGLFSFAGDGDSMFFSLFNDFKMEDIMSMLGFDGKGVDFASMMNVPSTTDTMYEGVDAFEQYAYAQENVARETDNNAMSSNELYESYLKQYSATENTTGATQDFNTWLQKAESSENSQTSAINTQNTVLTKNCKLLERDNKDIEKLITNQKKLTGTLEEQQDGSLRIRADGYSEEDEAVEEHVKYVNDVGDSFDVAAFAAENFNKKELELYNTLKKTTKPTQEQYDAWTAMIGGHYNLWKDDQQLSSQVESLTQGMKQAVDMVNSGSENTDPYIFQAAPDYFYDALRDKFESDESFAEYMRTYGAEQGKNLTTGMKESLNESMPETAQAIGDAVQTAVDNVDFTKFGEKMQGVVTTCSDALNGIQDPEIAPVVDLSGVNAAVKSIEAMNPVLHVSVEVDTSAIPDVGDSKTPVAAGTVINNNYNLAQNNYSPTAPTSTEMYRQGRSLMGMLKGATA